MTTLRFRRAIPVAIPDPLRPAWCEPDETAAVGVIELRPHARQHETAGGHRVVLPALLPLALVAGEATVDVEPGHWQVRERIRAGAAQQWTVLVPDAVGILDDCDLVRVDPATLTPAESAVPAWTAAVADVQEAADAADGSAIAAVGAAAAAASSATTATTKAGEAAASATAAASSASSAAATLTNTVTLGTTQTIPGAKTLTCPTFVAAVPAATFGPDLAPALSTWAMDGGTSWDPPNVTIPSGGSVSCTVSGIVAGQTYQIDVTRSASSGGDMTVTLGGASITLASWANNRTTVVAAGSGTMTLAVGGSSWVATVQAVSCRVITGFPSARTGGLITRASGYNNAVGQDSQRSLTTGSSNNAVGYASQRSPRSNSSWATTTASRQVSIGHESGQGSADQSDEIVTVGYWAIADGAKAMALGANSSSTHAGSVALGSDVTTTAVGQVAVGPRDLEVQDAAKGLILRSPDGSRWRVTISNAGVAAWTKL